MRQLLQFFLLLAATLPHFVLGQSKLVLENPSRLKRLEIEPGTTVGIRIKGMDVMFFGEYERCNAEYIYIFGDSIQPDSVAKIHIEQPHFWAGQVRGAAIMGMIIYPIMILINHPPRTWNKTTAIQLAAIWAGGLSINYLMKRLYFKRYALDKGKWQLRLMEKLDY